MHEMDYWAIAERGLEIQNPITDRKMRLLDDYCVIGDGMSVLDIGCGKAWLLRQWAERYDIRGTGIDINRHFLDHARKKSESKGLGARLKFVLGPAADYKPEPASFDVALCLGTAFALGGFVAALEWMATVVRPGGSIVIGDLILKHRPLVHADEVLPLDALDTIALVERHGSEVSATISASDADFERYISHHRQATLAWAREHPDHHDHADVLSRSRTEWQRYLRTIRPYLGWTIVVGRRND